MWKYGVWCIPIIHNIKTTDRWKIISDMQIIFLHCSVLLGMLLAFIWMLLSYSTPAQTSNPQRPNTVPPRMSWGVCLSGSDTRWDWDLVNLEARVSYFFSHVLGHSCAVLTMLWSGLSRWWWHWLWGAYMICSGLWRAVGSQSGICINSWTKGFPLTHYIVTRSSVIHLTCLWFECGCWTAQIETFEMWDWPLSWLSNVYTVD